MDHSHLSENAIMDVTLYCLPAAYISIKANEMDDWEYLSLFHGNRDMLCCDSLGIRLTPHRGT